MEEHLTSKQKIDKLLGIQDGSTIDDFLNNLNTDNTEIQETFKNIDSEVKAQLKNVDDKLNEIKTTDNANTVLALSDMTSSMKEVEDLIQISKQMFKHVYESIITTDLVDSELVGAASKLLEGIHINISEFISMYKDKQKFIEKIQLMVFQQEQKKELMKIKHQYDMEKAQSKIDTKVTDVENTMAYSVEDITKMLNEQSN